MNNKLTPADWEIIRKHLEPGPPVRRVRKERYQSKDPILWERLPLLAPPHRLLPKIASMDDAKKRLKDYLEQREERYENLKNFLSDNGVSFEMTEESVNDVNYFYARNVFCNEEGTDIHFLWYNFLWSYSLFLGDFAIKQAAGTRKLRWIATDVSIKQFGEAIRIKIEIGGYGSRAMNRRPDFTILSTGQHMLKAKENDLTAGGRLHHPYTSFALFLAESRRFAGVKNTG